MRAPRELFGAVEGSSGAKMGAQGCPHKKFGKFGVPLGAPKSTKEPLRGSQEHENEAKGIPKHSGMCSQL